MKIVKEKAVAFIGLGTLATADDRPDTNLENVIRTELQFVIDDLINEDRHIFLTGIEPGFDMLAAEVVLEYANQSKAIELYAVIPFTGHELCYSEADKLRYKRIYEAVTDRIYIHESYSENAYTERTDFILSNCSEVIVYDSGSDSDAKRLVAESDVMVLNMFDELRAYFEIRNPAKIFLQDYPNNLSFRYGREGVIFEGNNQPFPLNFNQIVKIERAKDFLCFILYDGLKIFASLTTDECNVIPARISESC